VTSSESDTPVPFSAWVGFIAMCAGMFMAILDIQVVSASLSEIQAGLSADQLAHTPYGDVFATVPAHHA